MQADEQVRLVSQLGVGRRMKESEQDVEERDAEQYHSTPRTPTVSHALTPISLHLPPLSTQTRPPARAALGRLDLGKRHSASTDFRGVEQGPTP